MFARILMESLARRLSRKVLAVVVVWLGLSLIVALLTLALDAGDKMNREMQKFGANIKVEAAEAAVPVRVGGYDLSPAVHVAYLREADFTKLKNIFWRNNILGVVPRLWTTARIGDQNIPLLGLWVEQEIPQDGQEAWTTGARSVYQHWAISGAWPAKPGECLVGSDLARRLGIVVGSELILGDADRTATFRVVGIVTTGDREDLSVVAPLASVQSFAHLEGQVSEADISALTTPENNLAIRYQKDPASLTPAEYERWVCTPYPGSVAIEVQKNIPGSSVRVVRRVAETQGAVLTRIEGLLFLLGLITLLACGLSVMGVLASAVMERRAEIALLQALGAHRSDVLALFFGEAGIIGLMGGILAAGSGIFLGQWLVAAIFGSHAEFHAALAMLAPLLGVVVALLGCSWPVWQTMRQDSAGILKGA